MTAARKRITILSLAIVLASALIIGATWAYFTDSRTVTNTFTVGNLEVGLEEKNWNPANGLGLLPGKIAVKDPVITMKSGSGYVRMIMTIVDGDGTDLTKKITDPDRLALILKTLYYNASINPSVQYSQNDLAAFKNYNDTKFELKSGSNGVYTYWYKNGGSYIMQKNQTAQFITHVVVPADWDTAELEKLGDYSVVFTAEAIYAEGFSNAIEAFAALDAQLNP